MKKYAMETTVGIFLVFGLLCIGYMTVKLGHVSLLGDNSYSLFARFTSVTGLRVGSPCICWVLRSDGWNDSPWTRRTRRRWWK